MPLLLYCVAPAAATDTALEGVGGAAVRSTIVNGMKFFYSDVSSDMEKGDIVAAAKAVYAVVNDIFSRGDVLPFRYPTILKDEGETKKLAKERGGAFQTFLQRTEGKAQIDIRLTVDREKSEHSRSENGGDLSGREYLQARAKSQASLSAAAESCRLAAHSDDWRIQQQGENIRCQALISRVEVLSFLGRMRALELPDGVKAAVSGPWPPAGFWDDDSG